MYGTSSCLVPATYSPRSHLASEAAAEYKSRVEGEEPTEDLFHLAAEIIPYFMAHNAEADACNLLMEVRLCCTCRSC